MDRATDSRRQFLKAGAAAMATAIAGCSTSNSDSAQSNSSNVEASTPTDTATSTPTDTATSTTGTETSTSGTEENTSEATTEEAEEQSTSSVGSVVKEDPFDNVMYFRDYGNEGFMGLYGPDSLTEFQTSGESFWSINNQVIANHTNFELMRDYFTNEELNQFKSLDNRYKALDLDYSEANWEVDGFATEILIDTTLEESDLMGRIEGKGYGKAETRNGWDLYTKDSVAAAAKGNQVIAVGNSSKGTVQQMTEGDNPAPEDPEGFAQAYIDFLEGESFIKSYTNQESSKGQALAAIIGEAGHENIEDISTQILGPQLADETGYKSIADLSDVSDSEIKVERYGITSGGEYEVIGSETQSLNEVKSALANSTNTTTTQP